MERDQWKCRRCGTATRTLNVHHIRYLNGYAPWEYPENYLLTLCQDCHEAEHSEIPMPTQSNIVTTFPLTKPGDEKFFGYVIGIGGNNLGEEGATYFAIFEYSSERTVYYLPHDMDLIRKLLVFLMGNLESDSDSGIYGKVWIKKTDTGWEVFLP